MLVIVSTFQEPLTIAVFYFIGIGCDAKVAYEFHVTRQENPQKFSSRVLFFLSGHSIC